MRTTTRKIQTCCPQQHLLHVPLQPGCSAWCLHGCGRRCWPATRIWPSGAALQPRQLCVHLPVWCTAATAGSSTGSDRPVTARSWQLPAAQRRPQQLCSLRRSDIAAGSRRSRRCPCAATWPLPVPAAQWRVKTYMHDLRRRRSEPLQRRRSDVAAGEVGLGGLLPLLGGDARRRVRVQNPRHLALLWPHQLRRQRARQALHLPIDERGNCER
jgi:hypothetical protein